MGILRKLWPGYTCCMPVKPHACSHLLVLGHVTRAQIQQDAVWLRGGAVQNHWYGLEERDGAGEFKLWGREPPGNFHLIGPLWAGVC